VNYNALHGKYKTTAELEKFTPDYSEAKVLVTITSKLFSSIASAHSDTNVKDSKKNRK